MARATTRASAVSVLFLLGLCMAISHYAVSLELSVNISHHGSLVQSVLLFLYPLAYAFVGVGAVIDHRFLRRGGEPGSSDALLQLAGVALLCFLILALRINGLGASLGGLVASVTASAVTLCAWFLLLGVVLSQKLSQVKAMGSRALALGWALHLAGLLLGYALNRTLVMDVGVNALLLGLGLALLAARFALPALVLLLFACVLLNVDGRVERLRDLSSVQLDRALGLGKMVVLPEAEMAVMERGLAFSEWNIVHRRWSPFALFMLTGQPLNNSRSGGYVGIYNFKHQWDVSSSKEAGLLGLLKRAVYWNIEATDQVMFIGVGGGRGLTAMRVEPHPGIVAVERDPAVVELFRDLQPERNELLFQKLTAIAADGRYAAESWPEPLDLLVLESARYQPLMALVSASSPYYLYTYEAMGAYLRALAPDGLMMVNFNRTGPGNKKNFLAMQVMRSLQGQGAAVDVVALDRLGDKAGEERYATYVFILASRDALALAEAKEQIVQQAERLLASRKGTTRLVPDWEPTLGEEHAHLAPYRLRDDRPFLGWVFLGRRGQAAMYGVSAAILLLVGVLAMGILRRRRPQGSWNPVPYFLLIGVAHTALQVATFYAWRSYFGDEISTMTRLLMAFLAYGALGTFLAERFGGRHLRGWRYPMITALCLGLHALGLLLIPFESSSPLWRELYAALALAPGGLLMGTFFPLGALRAHPGLLGRSLLADALGVLACYALFFLVFLPLGRWAFLAMAFAAYLVAAAAMGRPVAEAGAGTGEASPGVGT